MGRHPLLSKIGAICLTGERFEGLIPGSSEVGSQTGPHRDKKGSAMLQAHAVCTRSFCNCFSRGEFSRAVQHHQAERNAQRGSVVGSNLWQPAVLPVGTFELTARSMHGPGQL